MATDILNDINIIRKDEYIKSLIGEEKFHKVIFNFDIRREY
jgi:hypothetical protein